MTDESKSAPPTNVPFGDWAQAHTSLRHHGYVVIRGVLSQDEVQCTREQVARDFHALSPEFNPDDVLGTWKPENLPPQTRPGMFQSLVGNLPSAWKVRSHDNVRKVFKMMHAHEHGLQDKPDAVGKLLTSVDGMTWLPLHAGRAATLAKPGHDWPHADQGGGRFKDSIQGQVVLSNSTAGFRCSPRSHTNFPKLVAAGILKDTGKSASFFNMISAKDRKAAANIQRENGGSFQDFIPAPRGSMILWYSLTVHSGKSHEVDALCDDARMVFYVCSRPIQLPHVSDAERRKLLKRARKCWEENRMTNHSVEKLVAKGGNGDWRNKPKYTPRLQSFIDDPSLMRSEPWWPKLAPAMRDMLCLDMSVEPPKRKRTSRKQCSMKQQKLV